MKLKVNWPPTLMCAVCLCAGLPSMHSGSAQLDSPRCQAAVVAYRTPDDWSSQGHAFSVARFQVPGSRGSRGSASPLYLQSPLTKPTAITAAKELWINRLSLSRNIFMEDRSCIFFCRLCGILSLWETRKYALILWDREAKRYRVKLLCERPVCVCVCVWPWERLK